MLSDARDGITNALPMQDIFARGREQSHAVLWRIGDCALGFAGHPGFKVAMVEDLIMEFDESPADVDAGLAQLRNAQRQIEDALVPIMTGLVRMTGWMDERHRAA